MIARRERSSPGPFHDRARLTACVLHHFHTTWIAEPAQRLDGQVLPEGCYALAEQVAADGPDVITLESTGPRPLVRAAASAQHGALRPDEEPA